jgi:hypothetical protein
MPTKLNMVLENPKINAIKNNLAYLNSIKNAKQESVSLSRNKMDLSRPMLDRVQKVKSGCGGCGGAR